MRTITSPRPSFGKQLTKYRGFEKALSSAFYFFDIFRLLLPSFPKRMSVVA